MALWAIARLRAAPGEALLTRLQERLIQLAPSLRASEAATVLLAHATLARPLTGAALAALEERWLAVVSQEAKFQFLKKDGRTSLWPTLATIGHYYWPLLTTIGHYWPLLSTTIGSKSACSRPSGQAAGAVECAVGLLQIRHPPLRPGPGGHAGGRSRAARPLQANGARDGAPPGLRRTGRLGPVSVRNPSRALAGDAWHHRLHD
eukprot:1185540-Prorocentrum_minimum.AAC.5